MHLSRRALLSGFGALAVPALAQTVHISGRAPLQSIRNKTYDVVVYGGTVAGIAAARAASLNGMRVALLEPTPYLGGASGAGGLGQVDIATASRTNVGGTFWQLLQLVAILNSTAGQPNWPTTSPPSTTPTDPGYFPTTMMNAPPSIWKAAIDYYVSHLYNVDVYLSTALSTTAGTVLPSVIMSGSTITSLVTQRGPIRGTVFIDASYEGDILAGAAYRGQATYTIGRESSAQYSESLAGVAKQSPTGIGNSLFYLDSNGNPLFPFISNTLAANGSADNKVQVYGYRADIQPIANGGVAFTAPPGYLDSTYTWLGQLLTAASYTTLSQACTLTLMGNNEYNFNNPQLDYVNQDNSYPDGTPTTRAAIAAGHKAWVQGFLYYCANSPNVPAALASNSATYGYCGRAFPDNGNFPYQMYIREGRRMVGSYVMIQSDTNANATQTQSIGYGTYVLDNHPSAVYVSDLHNGITDAIAGDSTRTNFKLPMASLIPQTGQCTNLLVPVCFSCSHVAWQSTRYEAQFAIMGDAAGIMAASAVSGSKSVQSLVYSSDVSPGLTTLGAIF